MSNPTQSRNVGGGPMFWDFESLMNSELLNPNSSSSWQQTPASSSGQNPQHNFENTLSLEPDSQNVGQTLPQQYRWEPGLDESELAQSIDIAGLENNTGLPFPIGMAGTGTDTSSESGDDFQLFLQIFKSLPLIEQQKLVAQSSQTRGFQLSEQVELHKIFMGNLTKEYNRLLNGNENEGGTAEATEVKDNDSGFGDESEHLNGKKAEGSKEAKSKKVKSKKKAQTDEDMPYRCPSCAIGCRDKTSLRKHMYIHDPRRFFCDTCGMGFHTRRDLRRHQTAIHNGASGLASRAPRKFYICKKPKCDRGLEKPFTRKDNAKQHVVAVHGLETSTAEDVIEQVEVTDRDSSPASSSGHNSSQPSSPAKGFGGHSSPATTASPEITHRRLTKHKLKEEAKDSEDVLAEFTNLGDSNSEVRDPAKKRRVTRNKDTEQRPSKRHSLDKVPEIAEISIPGVVTNSSIQQDNMSSMFLPTGNNFFSPVDDSEMEKFLQFCEAQAKNPTADDTMPPEFQDFLGGMANLTLN
ncbi:hypothetical protein H072_11602 [Dactylellina haptotyla CBS 200.50]|uniref:C2H2-type domain-containing protein n=1 Tax=Dactylellina haptotyla (strain CBS 200.50) TaxID=1284197 RepID=S8BIW2_DACHA|nr:hypothetical protein H072_11602 [Dactylellina haptotyla CBS 200.50]